ncbi:MAG: radical SAM protein [Clostridia bacterium]|nr:radical SAM protein [Clostridia bacterium]
MKRSILPIFIPHLGCPHDCVFCDQKQIASPSVPGAEDVQKIIEEGLRYAKCPQISFYGGSFTAIDRAKMVEYLQAAHPYILDGRCHSIRLSTRPDAIDREVLDILRAYGVQTIELGAQSMVDEVLRKAGRGHAAEHTASASALISEYGFELILQMMVGLPGSRYEDELYTAKALARLKPHGVRIYPTCVLGNTALCRMYEMGSYRPMTVEEAVPVCADLLDIFEAENIPVIRLGLNPTEELSGGAVVAGPYHPAFGEMVMSERFFRSVEAVIPKDGRPYEIIVPPKIHSIAIGQKKANLRRFSAISNIQTIRSDTACEKAYIRIL